MEHLNALREHLRTHYGPFWRHRHHWLLLTGDDRAIPTLLPELADTGWLVTDHTVLLWRPTAADGQPDHAWLAQLYRLRRSRPLDAVILTLDTHTELPGERRGSPAYSLLLARIATTLRWAAPVYVLDAGFTDTVRPYTSPVVGCEFAPDTAGADIETRLLQIRDTLAPRAVWQIGLNRADCYGGLLSERLDHRAAALAAWLASLAPHARSRLRRCTRPRGVFFAPYPPARPPGTALDHDAPCSADLPVWQYLGTAARRARARRIGWHPATVGAVLACTVFGLWGCGLLISALVNAQDLREAQYSVAALKQAPDEATRLRALLGLQQQIDRYEYRIAHHAPLFTRFGLNHDREVLAALWAPYAQASRTALVAPVREQLEATLASLGQMPTERLDARTNRAALDGHDALQGYLMLAQPERAEAGFMTPLLARYWATPAKLRIGERLDLGERLLGFYAAHLRAHPEWRMAARPELVGPARQTLLAVIGVKNSQDTLYQEILAGVGQRYADQTLARLTAGTDPRGLVHSAAVVPAAYTRQAYEGYIAEAITAAAQRHEVARDWVLVEGAGVTQANTVASAGAGASPATASAAPSSSNATTIAASTSATDLQAALTARYFSDYAQHWQDYMNTLQWEGAPDLSSAIEQLTLLADARQSPLIALMNSLQYQAGASAAHQSLSDTLVAKAQSVLARDDGPTPAQADPAGALGAPFAPVLRLLTQGERGASDLSLQRYLERVTALRLKLQQIHHSPDADAQARLAAQALFQGRGSELADTQAYAQLLAASLGAQWAGMGEALFVRPVAQATRTVLQPAQASLNRAWREGVVASWERSFAGRYPFASTDNDASLAELARWLRPQGGLIDTFVGGQLAGVLELQGDQWVPAARSGAALAFDPAFLDALNTLQRVGAHLLAQGEAQYRFELMALPTPGLTDTVLMLDDQQLHYYNQRQSWQALRWPVSAAAQPGTRLQWQTEQAGTNKNYEFGGRWALLRMLERARVEPVDSATYRLTWQGVPDAQWRDEDEPSTAIDGAGTAVQQAASAAGQAAASNVTASSAATSNAATPGSLNDSLNAQGPRVPAYGGPPLALNYVMRTEIGRGPLELLALRGFVLPQRIFVSAPQPGVNASHAERPVVAADARYAAAAQARPAAQPWTVPPLPSLPQAPVAETASHAKEHTSAQTEVQTFTRPEETQNHTQLPATTRATL